MKASATPNAPRGPTARTVAATVLLRVWQDDAYAAAALDAELGRAVQLDGRDAGLCTELVFGVLRVQPWLEERVGRHTKKGLGQTDALVRAHLLLAAYQLHFLSRVPAFAAVSEAVDAVRRVRGPKVAAFTNAVLRRVAEGAAKEKTELSEAVVASTPPWLRAALEESLGKDEAHAFLETGASVPPTGIRVEDPSSRGEWIERLRAAAPGVELEASPVSPIGIRARGAGRVAALPGFNEGAWAVQEDGSQLVALALGAKEGETVLDACAGRGNKTAILARAVGPGGAADAADLHEPKLGRLREELARIGLAPRRTFAVDWSVGSGDADALYDAVLVDAPCSGSGTLRRRPDLMGRRTEAHVKGLAALQLAILARLSRHVRSGGRLVFAVCSVLREEAESVVSMLLASDDTLALAPFASDAARALAGQEPTLRLLPHVHGTDGYFLASFVKR